MFILTTDILAWKEVGRCVQVFIQIFWDNILQGRIDIYTGSRYDFVQLILYPDRLLNWLNKFKTWGTDRTGLSKNSNMSSANKDMWCEVFVTDIGSISSDWRTAWARGSRDKANSKGERGQPWRVPLPVGNYCEFIWPVRMVAEGLA